MGDSVKKLSGVTALGLVVMVSACSEAHDSGEAETTNASETSGGPAVIPRSAPCAATNGTAGEDCACTNGASLDLGRGPKMLCIEGGTFSMGSNRNTNEKPIHSVTLPSFWMDESEVTYGQYTACVNDGACTRGADTSHSASCVTGSVGKAGYPMNCLYQGQAAAFCSWAGKRLPLEEEWEYGATGANDYIYPWGNGAFVDQANIHTTGPVPVMQFPAGRSSFGLWDMSGNVLEWTASDFCNYAAAGITPSCSLSYRIYRGGSFAKSATSAASAARATTTFRNADDLTWRNPDLGFRCAKSN